LFKQNEQPPLWVSISSAHFNTQVFGLTVNEEIFGILVISSAAPKCLFLLQTCEPTEKCIKQTVEVRGRSGGICFKKAKVKFVLEQNSCSPTTVLRFITFLPAKKPESTSHI
jgi:hypothetical protein